MHSTRAVAAGILAASSRVAPMHGTTAVRTAVNLSALKIRIRATNNVAKITNVMKLVASSKLRQVEDALHNGRPFGAAMMDSVALKQPPKPEVKEGGIPGATVKDEDKTLDIFNDDRSHLVLAITTDRGLCGSVNSSLSRALRKELASAAKAKANVRLFVLGDKGRAQIARDYIPMMTRTVDSYLDRDPVFGLASKIAQRVIAESYDVLTLWYNEYENQVKFHNVYKQIPRLAGKGMPSSLKSYDLEPDAEGETLANMEEYAIASAIYYALLETVACETSQRVTAMDNASTNAKDMVDRFKLIYNRARQAKITTELTEIISGAESLQANTATD